jgi:hypothetical protein
MSRSVICRQLLLLLLFIVIACENGMTQNMHIHPTEKTCNAFYKWSSVDKAKLPNAPRDLALYLEEGKRYPSGDAGTRLDR